MELCLLVLLQDVEKFENLLIGEIAELKVHGISLHLSVGFENEMSLFGVLAFHSFWLDLFYQLIVKPLIFFTSQLIHVVNFDMVNSFEFIDYFLEMAAALPGSASAEEIGEGLEDTGGSVSEQRYFLFSLEAKIL
jgi:hypothetical protein